MPEAQAKEGRKERSGAAGRSPVGQEGALGDKSYDAEAPDEKGDPS